MFFWNIKRLVSQLQNKYENTVGAVLYGLLLLGISSVGFGVINLLPTVYFLVFTQIKNYLEQQAAPALLEIVVYHHFKEFFLAANLMIVLTGILFCLFVHKGTIKEFFVRMILLSWPISIRIVFFTLLVFCLVMAVFGVYFGYKLLLLSKLSSSKGSVVLRPLKYLLQVTKTYVPAKALWSQAQTLAKAQRIFDQISLLSFYSYWVCQVGSVVSTMWLMLTLQEKIRLVQNRASN